MKTLEKSILASVCWAAVADAIAMPLMTRTTQMIKDEYGSGKLVDCICEPLPDAPGYGLPRGSVTDAFSLSKELADTFVEFGGVSTYGTASALIKWNQTEMCARFCGQSTRHGIEIVTGQYVKTRFDKVPCEWRMQTNGAASRAWIAGLLNPGNPEQAIADAVKMSMITHNNAIGISGAAVVAALTSVAVCERLSGGKVLETAYSAVECGYEIAQKAIGMTSVGAKVKNRISWAAEIALANSNDDEKLLSELNDSIGFGAYASETVPSVIGILLAAGSDTARAVKLAANSGNQCNKTAVIVGAICAASNGLDDLSAEMLTMVERVNGFELNALAAGIASVTA